MFIMIKINHCYLLSCFTHEVTKIRNTKFRVLHYKSLFISEDAHGPRNYEYLLFMYCTLVQYSTVQSNRSLHCFINKIIGREISS